MTHATFTTTYVYYERIRRNNAPADPIKPVPNRRSVPSSGTGPGVVTEPYKSSPGETRSVWLTSNSKTLVPFTKVDSVTSMGTVQFGGPVWQVPSDVIATEEDVLPGVNGIVGALKPP